MRRTYRIVGDEIFLKFEYNKPLIDSVSSITGSWYNPSLKTWGIKIRQYNEDKIFRLVMDFGFNEEIVKEYIVDKSAGISPEELEFVKKTLDSKNLLFQPRQYQLIEIAYGIKHKSIINGSDMGLGKTFSSIMTVEAANSFPCLVITPSSVKYQFAESWVNLTRGERSVSVIDTKETKSRKNDWDSDVIVINYDILGKFVDNGRVGSSGKKLKDLELRYKELKSKNFNSVILDEAHFIKNSKAARSAAAKKIVSGVDMKLFLTGTPISASPKEAINLLTALGRFGDIASNWNDYVYTFCNAKTDKFGRLDYSGASNTLELNDRLRRHCYVRHEKADVLDSLPELVNTVISTKLSNKKEYDKAVNESYRYFLEKGDEYAQSYSEAEALVMLSELRSLSIDGKMAHIEQFLKDWDESTDEKIVVFGIHRDPIIELANKFGAKKIVGGVSAEEKRSIVKEFETSSDKFLFCNMDSAGTGTDGLQNKCSNMLIIELPHRVSTLDQTVARLNRSGQKFSTNIRYILDVEGIDGIMWNNLSEQREIAAAVNQGVDLSNGGNFMKNISKKLFEKLGN